MQYDFNRPLLVYHSMKYQNERNDRVIWTITLEEVSKDDPSAKTFVISFQSTINMPATNGNILWLPVIWKYIHVPPSEQ